MQSGFLQPTEPLEAELTIRKAPVEPIKARPSDEWLEWLASLNDTAIGAILTWDGGRHDEDTQRMCPTCGCKCSGDRGAEYPLGPMVWSGTNIGVKQSREQSGPQSQAILSKGKVDHPMRPFHQHQLTD